MCSGFIPSIFPGKFCEDTLGKYGFIRVCSGWPSGLPPPSRSYYWRVQVCLLNQMSSHFADVPQFPGLIGFIRVCRPGSPSPSRSIWCSVRGSFDRIFRAIFSGTPRHGTIRVYSGFFGCVVWALLLLRAIPGAGFRVYWGFPQFPRNPPKFL